MTCSTRRNVTSLCEEAGIFPAISPNELRHSAATLLKRKSATKDEIVAFLGHKDDRMVTRHYFQDEGDVRDLAEVQDLLLS